MIEILVGIPPEAPSLFETQLTSLLTACYNGAALNVVYARHTDEFLTEYHKHQAELVISLDDLRFGLGYSGAVGKRSGKEKYIVVIPDDCKGNTMLLSLIRDGFYNILFQHDFNFNGLSELLRYNRNLDEALLYCDVDFRPSTTGSVPDVVKTEVSTEVTGERRPGSSIKRRYLGEGLGVIQLYGKDADLLTEKGVEEENYGLDMFSVYELSEEEDQAEMPLRTYELDEPWVDEAKETLKNTFVKVGLLIFNGDSGITDEEIRKKVMDELEHMKVTGENAEKVYQSFLRDIHSYGRLDVLIHDRDVSDVRMMDYETINVQSKGQWYRTNVKFRDQKEYETFIQHICNANNVPFNWTAADVVFPDEKSFPGECMLRDAFTNKNLNVNRTMSGHIRITRKIKKLAKELIDDNFFTPREAALIFNLIKVQKKSVIICGGSGSGKTVLLNYLIELLPRDICGEIVQESSELFAPKHANIKSSNSIESKGNETKVEHNLKSLAEKALLRNTDVFIIGEIKGDEAAHFFSASRTTRVMTTLHADNCFGAIPRCAELALAAGAATTKEEIVSVLSRNIGVVIYCDHYRVKQIAEVKGYDEREHDTKYILYDFNAQEGA